jgi:beta-galactosidase
MTLPSINVKPLGTLLSVKGRSSLGTATTQHANAPTFEELDQNSGFVLYETTLPKFTRDPSELVINDLRDRAYIYVDEVSSDKNGLGLDC